MANLNRVQLAGFLGKNPEIKQVNDTTLAIFRMATNYSYRTQSGETKQITEWHRIVAWGWVAELVAEQFRKGDNVFIEGRLSERHWETQSGEKRTTLEVVAMHAWLLGPSSTNRRDSGSDGSRSDSDEQQSGSDVGNNEIPF